jgi:hypothetical protein
MTTGLKLSIGVEWYFANTAVLVRHCIISDRLKNLDILKLLKK